MKSTKSKKIKIAPKEEKIQIVKLHCENCGEDEERVLYCSSCDSPMHVVSVVQRDDDDVQTGIAVSSVKKDTNGAGEDIEDEVDSVKTAELDGMVESGDLNLGEIFPGGKADRDDMDNPPDIENMDDAFEALNRDE